ncbi:MAG: molybdenum cofactor guanylyltransferase [Pseudomonadota bacterium]|nr:MAG: molybdenum cofactor guanylyltransferase [Pseudomonadota bacterium]
MHNIDTQHITAIVLAGGQATRLGRADKGLIECAGLPLVAHVIARVAPQCGALLISANRNHGAYRQFGHPVYGDSVAGHAGPLAGMLTGLQRMTTEWALVVPCDMPLVPDDLATRLGAALSDHQAKLAVVHDGTRLQPLCALAHRSLSDSLAAFLADDGRAAWRWVDALPHVSVDFSDAAQCFANANDHQELARMATVLGDVATGKRAQGRHAR